MKKNVLVRILLVLAIVLILIALFRYSWMFKLATLPRLIEWVDQARSQSWLAVLFYVFFVFGVMVFPITLFPIVGGVLCDFWLALPLNLAAATGGAYFSFAVTRLFRRDAIRSFLKGRLRMLDHVASRQGFKNVLFLRLIGIPPFIVTNYTLGLSGVRPRDFVLGTVIGILPWMTLVTYAANSLWTAARIGGEQGFRTALMELVAPFSIVSLSILASTVIGYYARKRKKKTTYSNL